MAFYMHQRSMVLAVLAIVSVLVLRVHATAEEEAANASPVFHCISATECTAIGMEYAACQQGVCVETTAAERWQAEIWGSIAAFLSNVLAAGSGLGGGGLLVPMYILTMGLSSHDAIPLSKATIFGSAIASFIINLRNRHPLAKHRPLIDFETMLMMEPMTLAGTIIGVNMNAVFPEWLITVCVVWLLTVTTIKTYKKANKVWREETEHDAKICSDVVAYWRLLPNQMNVENFDAVARAYLKWKSYRRPLKVHLDKMLDGDDDSSDSSSSTVLTIKDSDATESDNSEEETLIHSGVLKSDVNTSKVPSLEELDNARNSIPRKDVFVLCLLWAGLVLFSLAKGGHGHSSIIGIQCGSFPFWVLIVAAFPVFVAVTAYFGVKILRVHRLLHATQHEYLKGDMEWTKSAMIKYPGLCTAAGVAAGLLGIGGGMVKGPLLLEMGLLPQVASATSSAMILFTSSATTAQFIILGALDINHALWHGFIGFVAGVVGQYGLAYVVKKYRKTALVIWLVAAVIGISCAIMGAIGIEKVIYQGFHGFRPLCKAARP